MASRYPLVKLVSAPDPAATVLMDFNESTSATAKTEVLAEGFSVGVPDLQGDPDSIFPAYGPRQIQFRVEIRGSKSYALGRQSAAARWLLRDNCWLLVQLTAAMKPAWFKLYRPQPGDLSLDNVFVKPDGTEYTRTDRWALAVTLPAEPFAYGARQTIGPVTINNNPAAGTNPCSYTLPTILGDAPAPLTASIYPDAETKANALLGVAPVPSSWAGPCVWQSSAFTAGVDANGTETSDATFSGGSYRAVTFATVAALSPRLSGAVPTTPPRGRYRLLARVARSDTSSVFTVQGAFRQQTGTTTAGEVVTVSGSSTAATWATLVDLGSFALPINGEMPTLPTMAGYVYAGVELEFRAGRTSGAGSLRVDYFLLIPEVLEGEPARNLRINSSSAGWWGSPWNTLLIDGDMERTAWTITGAESFLLAPQLSGGFPVVTPGFKNVAHFIPHVDPTAVVNSGLGGSLNNADSINSTTSITMSYHPRWLFIGDGS